MNVKERITTIRLLESIKKNPGYASKIGIIVISGKVNKDNSMTNKR